MKNRNWDREALMREVIDAMDSAHEDEDDTFDVRFYPNEPEHMRIRAVVSEAADGGEVLIGGIVPGEDPDALVDAFLAEQAERADLLA